MGQEEGSIGKEVAIAQGCWTPEGTLKTACGVSDLCLSFQRSGVRRRRIPEAHRLAVLLNWTAAAWLQQRPCLKEEEVSHCGRHQIPTSGLHTWVHSLMLIPAPQNYQAMSSDSSVQPRCRHVFHQMQPSAQRLADLCHGPCAAPAAQPPHPLKTGFRDSLICREQL